MEFVPTVLSASTLKTAEKISRFLAAHSVLLDEVMHVIVAIFKQTGFVVLINEWCVK